MWVLTVIGVYLKVCRSAELQQHYAPYNGVDVAACSPRLQAPRVGPASRSI